MALLPAFRDPEGEQGALAGAALGGDVAAVVFDDFLDDGQAEADGAQLLALGKLRVALEDPRQVMRLDAAAVVAA